VCAIVYVCEYAYMYVRMCDLCMFVCVYLCVYGVVCAVNVDRYIYGSNFSFPSASSKREVCATRSMTGLTCSNGGRREEGRGVMCHNLCSCV
jgi:hypothetical protein